MDPPSNRFRGFPYSDGLVVLDELTGVVSFVPVDGTPPRVIFTPGTSGEVAPLSLPRAAAARPAPNVMAAPVTKHLVLAPTALDREIVATYPYPIASIYERFFEERDPREKCRLLIDTFTTTLKLWALVLASDYIHSATLQDAALNDLLTRDFQRPLISAWHLFITRALSIMRSEKHVPFLAELPDVYDAIETRCQKPFLARSRYVDANGETKQRESKLGKVQALIKFRNGLAHGYNVPPARAEEHLATYLPVLREILGAAKFMNAYPIYCAVPGGESAAYRLTGSSPPEAPEPLASPPAGAIFVGSPSGKMLPLAVLLDLEPNEEHAITFLRRELLLFEGNTRNAVVYASALGGSVEKQSAAKEWSALLSTKAVEAKMLRRENLSLDALRENAHAVTSATLTALRASGKYIPEISYRQPAVRDLLTQFELGDYRTLVLGGESGTGKSTLLASLAEEHESAGDVVLFYRASSLLDADLAARIARDLRLREPYFEEFLASVDELFVPADKRLRIVIDGLNEHPGQLAAMVGAVDAVTRQAAAYPWVRVIVSVRTAAYERLAKNARFAAIDGAKYLVADDKTGERSPLCQLPPLATAEIGELYERYRGYRKRGADEPVDAGVHCFRPKSAFAELAPSTVTMMRTPLMLRLLVAAFHGASLTHEISYDEAMRLYFDEVIVGRSNPDGANWERGSILKAIVADLDQRNSDCVEQDELYDVPLLKRAMVNAQKDSPYVQLLELGVLTESVDGNVCVVRFAFNRLFEFMLAELYEARLRDEYECLALARRSVRFGALRGALVVVLARLAAKDAFSAFLRALEISETMPEGAPEQEALVATGRGLLDELSRTGRDVRLVAEAMTVQPTKAGARILVDASGPLLERGDAVAAGHTASRALSAATTLGSHLLGIRAQFALGTIAQRQGRLDAALSHYAPVCDASDNLNLAMRARVRRSEVLRAVGRTDEAARELAAAAEELERGDALADASEARRQQAILARESRDLDGAKALAAQALSLAQRAGDVAAEAQALVCRGLVSWRQGDLTDARAAFERALPLAESTGNVKSIASVIGSLGILGREARDYGAAIHLAEKQLDMAERFGIKRLAAAALQNLGVFTFEAGDLVVARASLERASELLRVVDQGFCAVSLVNLGWLDLHDGKLDSAKARLDEAALMGESSNPDARGDALWLLGCVAVARGEWTTVESLAAAVAAAAGDPEARRSQASALRTRSALAAGRPAPCGVDELVRGFDRTPRPEVHELPIDAIMDLALAEPPARRREIANIAVRLLAGRPHPRARGIADLAEASAAAS